MLVLSNFTSSIYTLFGFIDEMIMLCWNVKGLEQPSKRRVAKQLIRESKCFIIYLKETKLRSFDINILYATYDTNFDKWQVKEANGSSGGILTSWNTSTIQEFFLHSRDFSISTQFILPNNKLRWSIINVCRPHE